MLPRGKQYVDSNYPLDMAYSFHPGERYTVLAALSLEGNVNSVVAAKPIVFLAPDLQADTPPANITGPEREKMLAPATATAAPQQDFEQRWKELKRWAGEEYEHLYFDAWIVPEATQAGRPIELKFSMVHIGNYRDDHPVLLKKWKGNSGLEVLIRGPSGKPVPLTEKGKSFFSKGTQLDARSLPRGDAIDGVLRLDDLFELQAPGKYTILVSLPVVGEVDATYTARPITIVVKAPEQPRN
jgi:hypothetical protein